MSGSSEKASGFANVAIGKVKQGLASAVGSVRFREEGVAQESKGLTQQALGDVKAQRHTDMSSVDESEFKIRERAYDIWLEEGRPDGRHHEHWRRAEGEMAASIVPPPML